MNKLKDKLKDLINSWQAWYGHTLNGDAKAIILDLLELQKLMEEDPLKNGIPISYALNLQKQRERINKIPFEDLKLLDDKGNEINKVDMEDWKYTGLNNTDYINTYFWSPYDKS